MVPSAPRLLKKDRIILEKGEWLNDRIINGAQKLLKRQFPSIDGLHSTISVAANQADILRGGAIQILHVHGNHWLCTKIGEDKSEVKIFDSLYPTIRLSLVDQLMKLLHSDKEEISFHSMHIQQQVGVSDCGVYALAVATSLCYGEDPTIIEWTQSQMRAHLVTCLQSDEMRPFPRGSINPSMKGQIKKTVVHKIHCVCRQRHKPRENVKQCNTCHILFHVKCLNIPRNAVAASCAWTCKDCQ